VTWHLPASKADAEAMGCSRTHGCICARSSSRGCPVHALWDKLLLLTQLFPARWSAAGGFDWDLPLFPDINGNAVSKEAMTDTIRHAAMLLQVPLVSPDHTEQITGHSLRATGAQGFAKAGLDEVSIQLLGRWGSKAIRGYTREAALERSSSWARAVWGQFWQPPRGPSACPMRGLDKDPARAPRHGSCSQHLPEAPRQTSRSHQARHGGGAQVPATTTRFRSRRPD
jgi:hypothetical protein